MNRVYRKNAFSLPLGFKQVFLVIQVLFQICFLGVYIVPFLNNDLKIVCSIFSVSSLACVIFWVRLSVAELEHKLEFTIESGKLCKVCLKYVSYDSKHCMICNKCIPRYDHHCAILNTCIGRENYSDFMKALIFFLLFNLVILIFSAVDLVNYDKNFAAFYDQNKELLEKLSKRAMLVINIVCLALSSLWSIFLLVLLIFHFYLWTRDLTTYEYILMKREKKKIKAETKPTSNSENKTEKVHPDVYF